MRTLFLAKSATTESKVVGMTYADNILQAQGTFIQMLSSDVLQVGITINDTGAEEDSPAAKLLIAIFGDDES